MARIEGIKKSLLKHGFDDATIKEITVGGHLVHTVERMEQILDERITHEILDSHACSGGKAYLSQMKKIGKEIAGKSLAEKVAHVNSISSGEETYILNTDHTLSVKLSFDNNGKYKCLCATTVKKGIKVSDLATENKASSCIMPLAYCYCCAGSNRRHLQLQLGVELKTKTIVSSPINSKGEKPCEFVFNIVD